MSETVDMGEQRASSPQRPLVLWLRDRGLGMDSPAVRLALLGGGSAVVYLTFVILYPLAVHSRAGRPYDLEQLSRDRPWAAIVYVIGLLALFLMFAVALRLVRRAQVSGRLIVLFGVVFGLILIWLYPVTATDLFQYVLRARIRVVHGANPMAVPADQFPADPLLPFAGEWADNLSPYGPVWELLAEAVVWAGFRDASSGALALKTVALAAYLTCVGMLAWPTRGNPQALLFFAWNPLVLLEGIGNGHNDLLMLAWVLAAILLWERRRKWVLPVGALSIAVLIKASAAPLAPLLVIAILREQPGYKQGLITLIGAGGLALAIVLLTYLPFWPPWESIAGVVDELSSRYTYSIAAMLRMILREFAPADVSRAIPRAVGWAIFGVLYLWTAVQLWRRRMRLAQAGLFVYFVYLLTGTSYRIWYPIWLVPLAALHLEPPTRLRVGLLCFTSELSILMFYLVWRWVLTGTVFPRADWLVMHLITVPWQFGLPLLAPLWQSRRLKT